MLSARLQRQWRTFGSYADTRRRTNSIFSNNYFPREYCNLYSGKVIYIINCYMPCVEWMPVPSIVRECEHTNASASAKCKDYYLQSILGFVLSFGGFLCRVQCLEVRAPGVWSFHLIWQTSEWLYHWLSVSPFSQLPFNCNPFVGSLRTLISVIALCSRTVTVLQ